MLRAVVPSATPASIGSGIRCSRSGGSVLAVTEKESVESVAGNTGNTVGSVGVVRNRVHEHGILIALVHDNLVVTGKAIIVERVVQRSVAVAYRVLAGNSQTCLFSLGEISLCAVIVILMIFGESTFKEAYLQLESLSHIFGELSFAALSRDIRNCKVEIFKNEVHHGVTVGALTEKNIGIIYVDRCLGQNHIAEALNQMIVLACAVEAGKTYKVVLFILGECRAFHTGNNLICTTDFDIGIAVRSVRWGNGFECPVVERVTAALVIAQPAIVERTVCRSTVTIAIVIVIECIYLILHI